MSDPSPEPEACASPTLYGPCAPYATVADVEEGCGDHGLDLADVPPPEDAPEGTEPTPGPDVALLEKALLWASRRAFMATGYRFFGCCEAEIRPARRCAPGLVGLALPDGWPWASWGVAEILPSWASGFVPVLACGCPDAAPCACTPWDRIPLPLLPVREIVEVTIDGAVLDPAAYRVEAEGWLVRIDGETWPSFNAPLPLGEEGTWSVRWRHGLDLPPEGVPLVASYGVELAKACKGGECSLGPGIRVVRREGVEFAVAEPPEYREKNLTGFGPLDDWISLLNGGHVTEPPRIYRPGREHSAPILERA